jgi:hypothetical protein
VKIFSQTRDSRQISIYTFPSIYGRMQRLNFKENELLYGIQITREETIKAEEGTRVMKFPIFGFLSPLHSMPKLTLIIFYISNLYRRLSYAQTKMSATRKLFSTSVFLSAAFNDVCIWKLIMLCFISLVTSTLIPFDKDNLVLCIHTQACM